MKMTIFKRKIKNYKKTIISILFVLILLITSITIYKTTKISNSYRVDANIDLEPYFKERRESNNENLIISLYILEDLRDLVLRYDGENLYLKNLKECFMNIKENTSSNTLVKFSFDINPKYYRVFSQYPVISPYREYINNISENIQSMVDLKIQKDLNEMFSFKGECREYMDKNYPKNIFERDQFAYFSKNCFKNELSAAHMGENLIGLNTIADTKIPKYFIPHIMRDTVKNKKDNDLDLKSCNILNMFGQKKYTLVSLHACREVKNGTETVSYMKSKHQIWYGLYSGSKVKEDEIDIILNNPEYFLILFYEK